jgi:hypothetical protein
MSFLGGIVPGRDGHPNLIELPSKKTQTTHYVNCLHTLILGAQPCKKSVLAERLKGLLHRAMHHFFLMPH